MREQFTYVIIGSGIALIVLLFTLGVGIWRFVRVFAADGWLAALRSVDLRGVGLAAGGIATMVGVASAALVGYHKFNLFREGHPHLTIDLTASRRQVSPCHIHIGVTARLANTSKVAITISRSIWALRSIAPYDAAVIQQKTNAFFDGDRCLDEFEEFEWDWIFEPIVLPLGMTIEPGETDEITFDFIVQPAISSATIILFVPNDHHPDAPDPVTVSSDSDYGPGWYRRIFYDLPAL